MPSNPNAKPIEIKKMYRQYHYSHDVGSKLRIMLLTLLLALLVTACSSGSSGGLPNEVKSELDYFFADKGLNGDLGPPMVVPDYEIISVQEAPYPHRTVWHFPDAWCIQTSPVAGRHGVFHHIMIGKENGRWRRIATYGDSYATQSHWAEAGCTW